MSKILWDKSGEKRFETDVSNGVLYPMGETDYGTGVAWNGLTSVTESPSGAEPTPIYADGIKYLNLMSKEDFAATIEAYTYPDEFAECDGSAEIAKGVTIGQQPRKLFCFAYKTKIGNDTNSELGYKIHIIYNCLAKPSERQHQTVNDTPEAMTMSWEVATTPVEVNGHKATAHLTIDSTKTTATKLQALETKLFGGDSMEPTIVMPDEIATMMAENA